MAICKKCGQEFDDALSECPACRTKKEDFAEKIQKTLNEGADRTAEFDKEDISKSTVMSVLAYISFLVFIPLFAAKDSRYTRFHVNQGMVLFICEVVVSLVFGVTASLLGMIWRPLFTIVHVLSGLVNLVFIVLSVIGIVRVSNGEAKELPLLGSVSIVK